MNSESDLSRDNLAEMISRFDETGASQIMVEPVEDVTAYGVVDLQRRIPEPGKAYRGMVGVVEKPKADVAPPSNLAVVGRYRPSADIWPLLAKPPGAGDERQLT